LDGIERVLEIFDLVGLVENVPLEIIEVGAGRMFVRGRIKVRGTASGVEMDAPPFGQIIEFRDDLILLVDNYSDVAEAQRAAGLLGT
jgi:hypothetical protein